MGTYQRPNKGTYRSPNGGPVGRAFGSEGRLSPGTMSNREFGSQGYSNPDRMTSMELGDEIMGEQNNIRRQTELERRVERQLSRESRKGNIDAGINLLDLRRKGYTRPYGITNFDDNRNTATNSYIDRRNNIADMDAATNGEPINDGGVPGAVDVSSNIRSSSRNNSSGASLDYSGTRTNRGYNEAGSLQPRMSNLDQGAAEQAGSGQWVDDGNGGSKLVASNGGGNLAPGNVSAPQAPRGQQLGQRLGSRVDNDGELFRRLEAQTIADNAGLDPESAPTATPEPPTGSGGEFMPVLPATTDRPSGNINPPAAVNGSGSGSMIEPGLRDSAIAGQRPAPVNAGQDAPRGSVENDAWRERRAAAFAANNAKRSAIQESYNRGKELEAQGVTAESLAKEKEGLPDAGTYDRDKVDIEKFNAGASTRADLEDQTLKNQMDLELTRQRNLADRVTQRWDNPAPGTPFSDQKYRDADWTQADEDSVARRNSPLRKAANWIADQIPGVVGPNMYRSDRQQAAFDARLAAQEAGRPEYGFGDFLANEVGVKTEAQLRNDQFDDELFINTPSLSQGLRDAAQGRIDKRAARADYQKLMNQNANRLKRGRR